MRRKISARAAPSEFKPHGATEVRRAATAFMQMRERIERFVQQRTEMLAGISHDLKTPLTRMRLQLAMMPHDEDTAAMGGDIAEMERMLNEYLEFARGEAAAMPNPPIWPCSPPKRWPMPAAPTMRATASRCPSGSR